jgi:hypothetical protein
MYWVLIFTFVIAVILPEIIPDSLTFVSDEVLESIGILILGIIAIVIFVRNEKRIKVERLENARYRKQLEQSTKDLADSYSYIGEVNRKMDILMNVAVGFADRSLEDKNAEEETYISIANTAKFIMKGDNASLVFYDYGQNRVCKEKFTAGGNSLSNRAELIAIGKKETLKKIKDRIIIASSHIVKNVRSFIIIDGYMEDEERSVSNIEIMKVLASQSLFIYSYVAKR